MSAKDEARTLLARLVIAYNEKDRAALERLYSPSIKVWSALGVETEGIAAALDHVDELFVKLPDETMSADTAITNGDTLVVEMTSRGSDGSGQPYEIRFTEVFEIDGGQITEIRTYLDPEDVAAISL
jgi:ketosteroid isomerase-like protein